MNPQITKSKTKSPDQLKSSPWLFRTYSGHSTAQKSNALYKKNLSKGQTGLSVAFDLPTQTGYDSDHALVRGEVGKVGVPVCHIDDMMQLFDSIPLEQMNTSMTINATAIWLMALYITAAKRQGADVSKLKGTTQNDILKEYLSRGTYIFPPAPSLKLTTDLITYTTKNIPGWNPINVCPYHLQEAGATPVQELAYGLANAITILDAVKNSAEISAKDFPDVLGRISFFLDSGIRFVEEMCKTKAFTRLWKETCETRYGVTDEKLTRFRYGVQVNSLGLTEQQPENNIIRIVLETLGVTLSKESRARALQLPAWNESLGLPTPWDQQWSLRVQQILAFETDLLEYGDLFSGSGVIEKKVEELIQSARTEMGKLEKMGGVLEAIEGGYIKSELLRSQSERLQAIETGLKKVVGVNCYGESEASPLAGKRDVIVKVNESDVREQLQRLVDFKRQRNMTGVSRALQALQDAARSNVNIMPASLDCAEAGVTTGEWAQSLREIYGTYRAPTGIAAVITKAVTDAAAGLKARVSAFEKKLGHKIRFLVGKPGLDGHSNGAEQIAMAARDAGFEVIYQGIRLTPEEIVQSALQEDVDLIGLSILSGSHLELVTEIFNLLKKNQASEIPVVLGGIIPPEDEQKLLALGVKKIFRPSDYHLSLVMEEIVGILSP